MDDQESSSPSKGADSSSDRDRIPIHDSEGPPSWRADLPIAEFSAPPDGTVELYKFWKVASNTVYMLLYFHNITDAAGKLAQTFGNESDELAGKVQSDHDFRHYYDLLARLLLTSTVDAFLTYIVRILTGIFIAKPETLRSERQVPLRLVLDHDSLEDLIRTLAEEEVNQLAYKSIRDLAKEVLRRTGLTLFTTDEEVAFVVETIELRNLIVHNDGVVNRVIMKKLPQYADQLGEPVKISRHAFRAVPVLLAVAGRFDIEARTKFGLNSVKAAEFFSSRANS